MKTILKFESANQRVVEFANATETADVVCFHNEATMGADGWAHLAPFGDFPGVGVVRQPDGRVQEFTAVQRLDRAAAETMAAKFKSPLNRIKRYLTGCWIFNGHPDMANAGNKYPDAEPKGVISDLEVRADGLYCLPVFTNEGNDLLNSGKKLFFSGRWTSNELPEENGQRIFRPDQLKSAGLTPRPNLPVHHANDREINPNKKSTMKEKLILLLAALGIQFANDADEDKIIAAADGLFKKAKTADELAAEKSAWATERTAFANEKTSLTGTVTAKDQTITTLTAERDSARTNFSNERKARIDEILGNAITAGKITAAERPDWERRLNVEAQFANETAALVKLEPKIKTKTVILERGNTRVELSNSADRGRMVQELVNERMVSAHCSYDDAYAHVQRTTPALFAAMEQPTIQPRKN